MEAAVRAAFGQVSRIGVVGLAVALAGCDAIGASVSLQPKDLEPTRLSAAERQQHTAVCKKVWKGSVSYSTRPGQSSTMSEATAERMCDCFIDKVEDATNKVEFLIAMHVTAAMQNRGAPNSLFKGPPSLNGLAASAGRIGVSAERFQEMAVKARKVGEPAMIQCLERVTAGR
jgi:hypothetical protein